MLQRSYYTVHGHRASFFNLVVGAFAKRAPTNQKEQFLPVRSISIAKSAEAQQRT